MGMPKQFLVVGFAMALTACGGSDTAAEPAASVTVTAPPPVTVTAQPETAAPASASTAAPQVTPGVVPNVVCSSHQLAQDTMQAAGYYNLSEEDASGANRMLVVDSNWVTIEQTPPGGTQAPQDTTIILRAVKAGEDTKGAC